MGEGDFGGGGGGFGGPQKDINGDPKPPGVVPEPMKGTGGSNMRNEGDFVARNLIGERVA